MEWKLLMLCFLFLLWEGIGSDLNAVPEVAVAMTTIPPRFSFILPTLMSWINQEVRPSYIAIFVPTVYRRFRNKKSSPNSIKPAELLLTRLRNNKELQVYLESNFIRIIELDSDWGPITRFVGVSTLEDRNDRTLPDYWLFADDDVFYHRETVSKYIQQMRSVVMDQQNSVLSQFVEDYRVAIINPITKIPQLVPHVQGVDTYFIPSILFHEMRLTSSTGRACSLELNKVQRALLFFHQTCEESFYQDDYIVAFLLFVNSISVKSIWKGESVANHVDNVSKSNHQMHMSPAVFDHEQSTKACIQTFAPQVYDILCDFE